MQQHSYSASTSTFYNANLKRSRSPAQAALEIPRLPEIGTDLVLEVYTHHSLRPPGCTKPEDFTDNQRLALLGKRVLNAAVTAVYFRKKPNLSVEQMQERKEKLLCDDIIQAWVKSYDMAKRICCLAEYRPKLQGAEECRTVFCAYVGAVLCHLGQEAVERWIRSLVQYQEDQDPSTAATSEVPPTKKIKNEPISSSISFAAQPSTLPSSTSSQSQAYSPTAPYLNNPSTSTYQTRQVPPHIKPVYQPQSSPQLSQFSAFFQSLATLSQSPSLRAVTASQSQRTQSMTVDGKFSASQGLPSSVMRPNPLAPATPNAPFLPMFNQTAAQRGVKVDYTAEFSGPSHAGQWTVQCTVNGIRKGEGKGNSKQLAKEEAARQAYYSMGWS